MFKIISKSSKDTKKIASFFAEEQKPMPHGAKIFALQGNLGSGKTTFVQGFASHLGVKENILSPTFVLMKIYALPRNKSFKHLIHVDCYWLNSKRDAKHLNLESFFRKKDALILIEWAENIRKIIPKHALWIEFRHGKNSNERSITIA